METADIPVCGERLNESEPYRNGNLADLLPKGLERQQHEASASSVLRENRGNKTRAFQP